MMNIAQRFTLLVKGSFNAMLDSIEDPERSLHQLICDMQEELEAAKRAAARAMANEDRLRSRIAFLEKDAGEWQAAAERALERGDEGESRQALERVERAERQCQRFKEQLDSQTRETVEVRESIAVMNERVGSSKSRLQLLQAQMRQGEARRAVNKVMRKVETQNLSMEFERLAERVEEDTAVERAYSRLDDELSGDDLRRRVEQSAVDDAVEHRLANLRRAREDGAEA